MLPSKRKFFVKWKEKKEEVWKDAFRNYVSRGIRYTRMLQVERIFMAQEYGSTVLKGRFFQEQCDCPNFESRDLILLTRDWTMCDL